MKATTHESNPGRHTEVLRFQVVMSAQEYDTYSRLRRTIPTEKDEFQLRAAAEAARTATEAALGVFLLAARCRVDWRKKSRHGSGL